MIFNTIFSGTELEIGPPAPGTATPVPLKPASGLARASASPDPACGHASFPPIQNKIRRTPTQQRRQNYQAVPLAGPGRVAGRSAASAACEFDAGIPHGEKRKRKGRMKSGCHPTDQNAVGVSLVAGVGEHDRGRVLLVPNVPDRPSRWRGGAADWQKANGGGGATGISQSHCRLLHHSLRPRHRLLVLGVVSAPNCGCWVMHRQHEPARLVA